MGEEQEMRFAFFTLNIFAKFSIHVVYFGARTRRKKMCLGSSRPSLHDATKKEE